MITPTSIGNQFAEFAAIAGATLPSPVTGSNPALVQTYITLAYACMNPEIWADKLDMGATYLACHWMVVDGVLGAGASVSGVGPVSSRSAGGVSESYAVAPNGGKGINDLTDLGLTRYGLIYQRIKRGLIKTPFTDATGFAWPGGGGGW